MGGSAADGAVLHAGDVGAQLAQALDNLETVLRQPGTDLGHVIRLSLYTTDVDGLLGAWGVLLERLGRAGCTPASTLLGVVRLAFPELLVEVEATALVPLSAGLSPRRAGWARPRAATPPACPRPRGGPRR
jgi:enamine deaminase RidA (YjgF/YER057c/UK114 family)